VRSEEVLNRIKEERRILDTIERRKANFDGSHLLKHIFEGKVDGEI
jgi:hypothetical protein